MPTWWDPTGKPSPALLIARLRESAYHRDMERAPVSNADPQQLNRFLVSAGGYTERGWIYWDRAAWFAPDRVRHMYEDLASYQLIDSNLARGNPVIVRVRLRNGVKHFVVVAGKDGFDYLVRDPGAGAARGLYPLRELGSNIEALRFYEPVTTFSTSSRGRAGQQDDRRTDYE